MRTFLRDIPSSARGMFMQRDTPFADDDESWDDDDGLTGADTLREREQPPSPSNVDHVDVRRRAGVPDRSGDAS